MPPIQPPQKTPPTVVLLLEMIYREMKALHTILVCPVSAKINEISASLDSLSTSLHEKTGGVLRSVDAIRDDIRGLISQNPVDAVKEVAKTTRDIANAIERYRHEELEKPKLIEFKDLTKVAASTKKRSDIYGETLGCRKFVCYCQCDRDAEISFELGESPMEWYPLEDREHSDVKPEHANGTVGTTAVTITPSGMLSSVLIHNTHASQTLSVSFDSGDAWLALDPDQSVSMPSDVYSYQLKGSAAGTNYEIINIYYLCGWKVKSGDKKVFEFSAPAAKFIRVVVENLSTTEVLAAEISVKAID